MKHLMFHRVWLALLGAGLLLLLFMDPLLDQATQSLRAREVALMTEKDRLLDAIRQRREDAATAEHYGDRFDDERLEALTAPANREAALVKIEALASAARFSGFAASLGDEEPLPHVTPDTQNLRQTPISLEGRAPHDNDLYRFLDRLGKVLPGRLDIQKITVTREEDKPLSDSNLSFTATLIWIAPTSEAGAKP